MSGRNSPGENGFDGCGLLGAILIILLVVALFASVTGINAFIAGQNSAQATATFLSIAQTFSASDAQVTGNFATDDQGRFNLGTGGVATYHVDESTAGTYDLRIMDSGSEEASATVEVSVNGNPSITAQTNVQANVMGAYPEAPAITVQLNAGENIITLSNESLTVDPQCNPFDGTPSQRPWQCVYIGGIQVYPPSAAGN